MKKIQKCLGIGLSFLIMTSCINLQSMANETDLNSGGEILQDLYNEQITEQKEVINEEQLMSMLSAQSELNHINAKLQDQVVIRHYSEVVTRSGDVDDAETLYADYYSGSYIEDSKLIVCISENGSPSNLSQDVLNEESVEIKKVTFSYNELLGFQTNIEDKYEEYYTEYDNTDTKEFELLSSIAGIGIDISNNCVYVDIADLTKEKENTYHTLFGEDEHASLRSVEHLNQDAATFKPGRAIYIILSADPLKTTRASMGYRAFWRPGDNDVYGFASCAHAIENAVGKKIYMGSNFEKVMGIRRVKKRSGSVDASFMQIASGHSVGSQVKYSDASGGTSNTDTIAKETYMTYVAVGTVVIKNGFKTYRTTGKVLDNDYTSTTTGGYTFTNMTKAETYVENGDSGGIVYTYFNSEYVPCGLVASRGTGYSVFTKADRVATTIKVYPY